MECRNCMQESAWIQGNSLALKIVLDRERNCRYFAVTSDISRFRGSSLSVKSKLWDMTT
jgi:hypothetical protein